MATEDDKDIERYRASLRRQEMHWRAQFETVQENERAAVDIGLMTLRTALLINAGAAVALIAFVAQLWGEETERMTDVLNASKFFVWGLFCAAVAAGVAYFYQSAMSAKASDALEEISRKAEDFKPRVWVSKFSDWTRAAMVSLVLLSYVFFLSGAQGVMNVIFPA